VGKLRARCLQSLIACAFVSVLTACTDRADVFPLNDAAHKIGTPTITFVGQGIDRGPITITMPDGEVLHGYYRVARSGGEVMTFSGGQTANAIGFGDGAVQFVAKGPLTELLCRGTSSISGHGSGQCQTFEGALWTVNY